MSGTRLVAQSQLLPLDENPALKDKQSIEPAVRHTDGPRYNGQNCPIGQSDILYVEAGLQGYATITIDTVEKFPNGGVFVCDNCSALNFGQGMIDGNRMYYTANPDVTVGDDIVEVRFCNIDNTSDCKGNQFFKILAKRRGLQHFIPTVNLQAGGTANAEALPELLPGDLQCNYFVDCADNYTGREQLVYFSDYDHPDYRLIYRSARYAGLDSVCVALCDVNTICDTFHFSFRIQGDTLNLPFLDDFSYQGPETDPDKWMESEVFVNNTMAINPPSVGVATFDGLNNRGKAYGGSPGRSDQLTSNYINLQGVGGDVILSAWVQRRGLGDKPELADSLILEFKLKNGNWDQIASFAGAPPNQPLTAVDTFKYFSFPVPQVYRYKGFQFRFTNFSDRQGVRDNWHVDYVRMDNVFTTNTFNDVAFSQLPTPILADYTSMPWRHFREAVAGELAGNIKVGVFNQAAQALNASPSSVTLEELTTGTNPFGSALTLFNGQEANIANGIPVNRTYLLSADPTGFPNVMASYIQTMEGSLFPPDADLKFRMTYQLSNTTQIVQPGYEAVQRNDKVTYTTVFDEYFAHDDGTAEAGLVTNEGGQIAVKFTSLVPDSLRAVQIMHPRSTPDASEQNFRMRVWIGQLDGSPEYSQNLTPYYPDQSLDTIQGFTTYVLKDADGNLKPLYLPAGDFYVGWQQVSNCVFNNCVQVGYDRNNEQAVDFAFENLGQGWIPLDQILGGAIMIRPVVGTDTPPATKTDEAVPAATELLIFPNPARSVLHIRMDNADWTRYNYQLFNQLGQMVQGGGLEPELSVGDLPAGVYWLKVEDSRQLRQWTQKVVVVR